MGTKVFERAHGRTFAQDVTRTRYGGAVLFHISLHNIMLHTRFNLYLPVTKLSTGLLLSELEKQADCIRQISTGIN